MRFLQKILLALLLIHVTATRVFHFPLAWLCKVSGRDNYFWAKVMFWISLPLCISAGWGVTFLVFCWIVIPIFNTGKVFYLPAVANKMRSLDGELFPIEMVSLPQLIFHHIFNFSVMAMFLLLTVTHASAFDFATITGYLLSYMSVCFLLDRQSGGKSLFKRVSERLKKTVQAAKEKLGSEDALPQPV